MGIPYHDIRQWSAAEIMLYQCYYRVAPWGAERDDVRNAMSMAQTANMHRDPRSNPTPFGVDEFMPFSERREKPAAVTTTSGLRAAFRTLTRKK